MNSIIVKNSIICNNCKEEIISEHRHDFKMCSCRNCGVDGGLDYLRRIGDNWTSTSIETNDITIVREHLKRNGTTLLKDMETDWIENVITYEEEKRPNNPLLPYYKAELKLRNDSNNYNSFGHEGRKFKFQNAHGIFTNEGIEYSAEFDRELRQLAEEIKLEIKNAKKD